MVHGCAYRAFEWLLGHRSVETADRSADLLGKARQGKASQVKSGTSRRTFWVSWGTLDPKGTSPK